MSETSRTRNILAVVFGTLAVGGLGIGVWSGLDAIQPTPTLRAPCIDERCFACLAPSTSECGRFLLAGGERADPLARDGIDPYAGAAGRLGRNMRQAMDRGAMLGWHTSPDSTQVGGCLVTIFLDRNQRRAWRQVIDTGAGNELVDCRRASLPGGRRGVVQFGTDPAAPEVEDSDDAGPDLQADAGP